MIYWRTVDKNLLEPVFVADLEAVLGSDEGDWYVTWGRRSSADQLQLYQAYLAGGPKAAPPGESAHEYGLAIDLALDGDDSRPRLQPEWNEAHPAWIRLRGKVDAHLRLHGGWWFGDGDHLEKSRWKQFTDWETSLSGAKTA